MEKQVIESSWACIQITVDKKKLDMHLITHVVEKNGANSRENLISFSDARRECVQKKREKKKWSLTREETPISTHATKIAL